ncbi:MAG: aminotransferase class V-fold PLP-dependent enzyme [Defluviitaleaceae bacterium]|nr:aminotransferase class V-fold PLP-dependent enzyme [Defluviitaleaceae bacterium]
MNKVYADNGSTSFPKAPGVADAVKDFLVNGGYNVGRGGYEASYNIGGEVLRTRQLLCGLFKFNNPRNVIFTPSITYSLNMILQGFLKSGDHVITTTMEHNGLMRPLHRLAQAGVTYDMVTDLKQIEKMIKPATKAVVMTHASNVCGTIFPINKVGEICKRHGVRFIVDAAQTAGVMDIDMEFIDALAFTAHKGLLAPQGLGGFLVKDDFAGLIDPTITGGTGSASHQLDQPHFLPDKFEAGTINLPAIMGLKKSLEYILEVGVTAIFEKEMVLVKRFIEGVDKICGVDIIGKKDVVGRTAVVSLNFKGRDNAEVAALLDGEYGIMTRCGLHCSPNAHKTLGTYPHGTVRFSFGHFNTLEEVGYIIRCIKGICA